MSDNIIQLNEDLIKHDLKDLVRSSVEETLNALLDKEADELVNAQNMSVLLNVRATAPAIISGTFRQRLVKWSLMFLNSKVFLLRLPLSNATAAGNLPWKKP